VTEKLRDRVLVRLGLDGPAGADLPGLRRLYRAWCLSVPFDNVRKLIALRAGAALPGRDAADFFTNWLETGAGGTCWSGSNALYALLRSLGFQPRLAAGSMHDLGSPNHGTVIVTIGGVDWRADTSLLTHAPIPLACARYFHSDGLTTADLEYDSRGYLLWTNTPHQHVPTGCRIFPEPVGGQFVLDRYEASRNQGPFNDCVHVRRNFPGRVVVVRGATRFERTVDGISAHALSADELCAALEREMGLSRSLISGWCACGGLTDKPHIAAAA
jgi:N-hydroxyarylamine O-acetyltransferase